MYLIIALSGNGNNKTRRSRDFNKQNSGSTTDSDDEFVSGTTTRRAWSDYCKGRSSQSEDEVIEKKKKVSRAKRVPGPKPKVPKPTPLSAAGRIRKRGLKRPPKIDGLDLLHTETLFSTSDQAIGLRLPPAAGCVDEHLTNYVGTMIHEELDVPPAHSEVPYALKILLDVYKAQFMSFLDSMKSSQFKENLKLQIDNEREKNKRLLNRTGQLEKQIKVLVEDSVVLLKARMQELGINTSSQNDLLCKAKEIVGKHKELQIMANKIQAQVSNLEEEHNNILASHVKKLADKHSKQAMDFELASKDSHDLVLKEIENTFIQRKNLRNKISSLEAELALIEKANDDKQQKQSSELPSQMKSAPPQPPGIYVSGSIYKQQQATAAPQAQQTKSKKNREHRPKTHEWPEIPEIGKIDEKNPEILAQKILETGRQIEAGKLANTSQPKPQQMTIASTKVQESAASYSKKSQQQQILIQQQQAHPSSMMPKQDLMISQKMLKNATPPSISLTHVHGLGLPKLSSKKGGSAESHKVVNFEDRLKSIITSALQGQDQAPTPSKGQPQSQQQQQQPQMQQQQPMMQGRDMSPKKIPQQQSSQYPGFHGPSPNQLTISTVGPPHHLSSSISPNQQQQQSSPIKNQRQMVPLPQMAPHLPLEHQRELQMQQESNYVQMKRTDHMPNFAKVMNIMHHETQSSKMYQRHQPSQMSSQMPSQMPPQMAQQMMQQQQQQQFVQREMFPQRNMVDEKREFKTPDNVRYERQDMGRSSVGSIENEYINSGGSSSSNKSQTQRSSSSLSQPDYTQVSPAKLALRRHLSQEKLAQHPQGSMSSQLTTKTIGDFINSEIEKTLEITPQSIINAVIQHNMPSSSRHESIIDCSINQDRDMDDHHHPYATLKPTANKQQQQYMHDPYADHRSKMLPITSKYISPTSSGAGSSSNSNMRKSAIPTPPLRSGGNHDEAMNYQQESSYKIDTKMFTSNIGMSMRKEEKVATVVEHEPPLEGLAASLRQHVIASMKIKEESENEPKFPTYPPMPYPHIIKKECKLTLEIICLWCK